MAEEENIVDLDEIPNDDLNYDINLALVRKVLTIRSYKFKALKRTLNRIWSIRKATLFHSIENRLFVVQCAHARDKAAVLASCPWTFDQKLVILNEFEGSQQPSYILMNFSPFWIRLYNLPLGCRTSRHLRLVAGSRGEVLELGITMEFLGTLRPGLEFSLMSRSPCEEFEKSRVIKEMRLWWRLSTRGYQPFVTYVEL